MTISYSGGYFRLLGRWKGSIWKSCWKECVIFLTAYYALNLVYRLALNDDHKVLFERIVRQFNHYIKSTPITFLLGFYVTSVVQRWWQQFENVSWPEDMLNLVCYIIPQTKGDEGRLKRRTIARYLVLAQALCWRDISLPVQKRFPTIGHLVKANLMTEEERKVYEETSISVKWFLPLQWAQRIVEHVEGLQANIMNSFIKEVVTFRICLRKLYCYDWVSIPLVYTQVATLVTYGYFCMCVIGRQYLDPKLKYSEFEADLYVPWYSILQLLFYIGWFKVGKCLMRPFGQDDDDLELNYLLDRNLKVSLAIVDEICAQCPVVLKDPLEQFVHLPHIPHTVLSLDQKRREHPPKQHHILKLKCPEEEAKLIRDAESLTKYHNKAKRREF